jgi:transcription initiation factor TFIIB
MNNQAVKAAQEAVLCRRSPISIAAAVIYMITQLSEDKKPLKRLGCCPIVFYTVTDIQVTILENQLQIYPWLLVWQKAPSEISTRICVRMPQGPSRIPMSRKKT